MIAIVASPPTIQASYERAMNAMTARPSYGGGYTPSYAELAGGQPLKLNAAKLPTIKAHSHCARQRTLTSVKDARQRPFTRVTDVNGR